MWVPLVENNELKGHGTDFFIKKDLKCLFDQEALIDVVLLACTHYPLLQERIEEYLPIGVKLLSQGEIVANSLAEYLKRHPEIETRCSKKSTREFYTTDSTEDFDAKAGLFYGEAIKSQHVEF